jgi:hypothetical protein
MANTRIALRRTTTAAKVPTTGDINTGELGLNMTDQIMYASNGSLIFAIGNNLPNNCVTTALWVGNSSINTAINSTAFSVGNIGGNISVNSASIMVGNSTVNSFINATSIKTVNLFDAHKFGGI